VRWPTGDRRERAVVASRVGSIGTPGYAWVVEVWGNYAYVAAWGGLRVIDVSTPSAPVECGSSTRRGAAFAVRVSGGYAMWLTSSPAFGDRREHAVRAVEVGFSTRRATPATSRFRADMRMWRTSTWAFGDRREHTSAPVEVGFVETPGDCNSVAVLVGHAYVADGSGGLRVIDISTPSAPVEVGFVDTGATGVAVAAGYAYVAEGFECGRRQHPVSAGDGGGSPWALTPTMLRCRATTRTSRAPVSA